jgi:hypothetical protein
VIEVYRIGENGDDKPIRLKIEDKLILNKKGNQRGSPPILKHCPTGSDC